MPRRAVADHATLCEALEPRALCSDVTGSANAAGRLTLIVNDGSSVEVIQTSPGAAPTLVSDLAADTGCPDLTGPVLTWTDPHDGLTYAAASSAEGLIVLVNRTGTMWTWRNLSAELIAPSITGLTEFTSTDGIVSIAGLDAFGDLILFQKVPGSGMVDSIWQETDLTQQLAQQGQATPDFTGGLISYVTSWNGMNIAGLDSVGHVQAVWWAPGMAQWRADDLTVATGAPAFAGSLTAYLTPWGGINLAGTDADGKVSVTWWVPGADWATSNLSDMFAGPALEQGSLSSYVTPWGGLNVAGLDPGGALVAYWWAPGMDSWSVTSLSDIVSGDTAPVGTVTGVASPTGTINLCGLNAGAQPVRYYWNPGDGGTWSFQELQTAATPVSAAPNYAARAGTWRMQVTHSDVTSFPIDQMDRYEFTLGADGRFSGTSISVDPPSTSPLNPGTWSFYGNTLESDTEGQTVMFRNVPASGNVFVLHGGDFLFGGDVSQLNQILPPEFIAMIEAEVGSLQAFVDGLEFTWTRIA